MTTKGGFFIEEKDMTTELEQQVLEAEPAEEPNLGSVKPGTVLKTDEHAVGAMGASSLKTAGWSYVYDLRTGDPSLVNNNMLRAQLRKRDPETGSLVFTTRDPGYRPASGKHLCWLHKDSDRAEVSREFGFPECQKSNLISPFEAEQHVRRKHGREHTAIREYEERKEREEDRRRQDELIRLAISQNGNGVATTVSQPAPEAETNESGVGASAECINCGDILDAKNAAGLRMKFYHHNKREHPDLAKE